MKRHVSSFEPPTYADAVRRATVYEAYSPKARKPKPDMLIAPIGNPQKSGPGPRIPPLMSTPPRPPGPQTVNPQGYSMPPAGWGPPMGNPSPQPSFPGQPPARPRRPRSEITCYRCREKGHFANECQALLPEPPGPQRAEALAYPEPRLN